MTTLPRESKPYTFDRVVRLTLTVGLFVGFVWLMWYLSDILIPFVVALLLAYLLNPLVSLVQRKVKSRLASVMISLILVACLVFLIALLVVPMIVSEIGNTGRILSEVTTNSALAERAARLLPSDLWKVIRDYAARDEVRELFNTENIWKITETVARKFLPGVWGLITGTASFIMGLVGLLVIGLYLIFILLDYEKISRSWGDLLPGAYRERIKEFAGEFEKAMSRYFRAQAAVASIVGILFAVGFSIIDLPMGILLGLFVGLLNMVPYLQIIGLIPAFFLALVQALEAGSGPWMALGLTVLVFAVVQVIQDTILTPKIMGKVTGLNPAMILLSLSVWGKLLGFLGLIIALPMTCLFLAYYRRFIISVPSETTPPTADIKGSIE
jgi:predicted PurR-regulated permease PerM